MMDIRPTSARQSLHYATLTMLVIVHAGLIIHVARVNSPGVDEIAHLAAGLSHVTLGTFDLYRVNPPLHRLPAGATLAEAGMRMDWSNYRCGVVDRKEFALGATLAQLNAGRYRELVFVARLSCLPWSLLGMGVCYLWGRDLYGPLAGLLSAGLWAFCSETIAHGAMVTPDVCGATFGLLAAYVFWRWLRQPNWLMTIAAGLAIGLAWLSKFTWIVVLPLLWPLLALAWAWRERPGQRAGAMRLVQVAAMFFVGLDVLNLGYGFERTFRSLGEFEFRSEALGGEAARGEGPTGNRFRGTALGSLPVPLPRNVLLGIDVQKDDFERGIRSYLRGEWQEQGWRYYYLYAAAVKLPLGLWLLGAFALFRGRFLWDELVVVAPSITLFAFVSSQTGFNHHFRYVLPALPFLFVFAGRLVAGPAAVTSRVGRAVVVAAFGWIVAACLWIHPHQLSYFNELAGGPRNGHAHLVDSNIDWGQDLWLLQDWLDENQNGRPLGLAYFGSFIQPHWFGIEHDLPPSYVPAGRGSGEPATGEGPQPGLYAISVNFLRGLEFTVPDGKGGAEGTGEPRWTYFLEYFEPVATAGYSIYIYDLSPEEVDRVRRKLGLESLGDGTAAGQ